MLSAVFVIGAALITSNIFYNEDQLEKSITHNTGDYVVLLHGLGRSSLSMQKLGVHLADRGFKVINVDYPTTSDTIENLSADYLHVGLEENYTDRDKKINFVTHSMGGIVTRYYLATNKLENVHRVVMLAPPNQGSTDADRWSEINSVNQIVGPALQQLTTHEKSFVNTIEDKSTDHEIGVLAGEYDFTVRTEEAQLSTLKDFKIVPTEHSFIMFSDTVIKAVGNFLETGVF